MKICDGCSSKAVKWRLEAIKITAPYKSVEYEEHFENIDLCDKCAKLFFDEYHRKIQK